MVFIMLKIMRLERRQAHACAVACVLPMSIVTGIIYFFGKTIDWQLTLFTALGGAIGGIIGAWLLARLNSKLVTGIFALVMIVLGFRMILS